MNEIHKLFKNQILKTTPKVQLKTNHEQKFTKNYKNFKTNRKIREKFKI